MPTLKDIGKLLELNRSRTPRALMRFIAFAAVMAVSLAGISAALSTLSLTAGLLQEARTGRLSFSLLLVLDAMTFATVLLFSKLAAKIEKRPLGDYGLPFRDAFRKPFWFGLAWGLCLAFLDIEITYLLGGFTFGGIGLSVVQVIRYGFGWAMAFILVGLYEEFLYRGYALQALRDGLGFWPAAVLLSALFGGLHLMNAGESATGVLNVFIYSLFACFTRLKTGNLWFAVGLHAAWDFSLTFLYSVPGSGMLAKGQLLGSSLHGPTWLTGGTAGPEGSAIGLAVVVISFPIFAKLSPALRSEQKNAALAGG